MLRIYADFNQLEGEERRVRLRGLGALRDIEKYENMLEDGMEVILYQTNELEVQAKIVFDIERNFWVGIPDWNTIVYYDESS